MKKIIPAALWCLLIHHANAQSIITPTAVPFLQIETNAQSYGSGAIGVVAPDIYTDNGFNQNPAHLARGRSIAGGRLSYVPWLRAAVPDVNLFEAGGYYSYNDKNTLGTSFRFIRWNEMYSTVLAYKPSDLNASLRYAHLFSEHLSAGAILKYIRSTSINIYPVTAQAFAGDLGLDFRRHYTVSENTGLRWNAGLSLLNIGNKMDYGSGWEKQFLPASLKLGTLFTFGFKQNEESHTAVDIGYQAEKLLVPTPPIYARDAAGNPIPLPPPESGYKIDKGYNPDVSVFRGLYQSFYDAPNGIKEEGQEYIHQLGTELRRVNKGGKYLYVLRGGYFYENEHKSARQFFTAGMGLGYCGFSADIARLIPTERRSPLSGTWIVNIGVRTNLHGDSFRFKEKI